MPKCSKCGGPITLVPDGDERHDPYELNSLRTENARLKRELVDFAESIDMEAGAVWESTASCDEVAKRLRDIANELRAAAAKGEG